MTVNAFHGHIRNTLLSNQRWSGKLSDESRSTHQNLREYLMSQAVHANTVSSYGRQKMVIIQVLGM